MALYDETQTTGEQAQAEVTNFLERVVKEKGDKWSDPETLAKGYASAQEHIANLERQISEQAEDLQKSKTLEEVLEQVKAGQATPTPPEPAKADGEPNSQNTTDTLSEDKLKSLIKDTLSAEERARVEADNLRTVKDGLVELFGTNAASEVKKQAGTLGMTEEQLEEIAVKSPDAFFKLIGQEAKVSNPTRAGSVNTAAGFTGTSQASDTWSYYQEMRRKNPKKYYSAPVQKQILADRERLGASNFYK